MVKVNFSKKAKSIMSERYISRLPGNAHNKTIKWRYLTLGVMKRKTQGKILTTLKQGLLKESRNWIIWK